MKPDEMAGKRRCVMNRQYSRLARLVERASRSVGTALALKFSRVTQSGNQEDLRPQNRVGDRARSKGFATVKRHRAGKACAFAAVFSIIILLLVPLATRSAPATH